MDNKNEMEKEKRGGKILQAQKNGLIEFLEEHPKLLSGKFDNNFTYKISNQFWCDAATILNSIPGAQKDGKAWKKTWQDIKCEVRKKASVVKKYAGGTGGGPPSDIKLSDFENKVIELIGATCISGNDEVPESEINFIFPSNQPADVEMDPGIIVLDEELDNYNDYCGKSFMPPKTYSSSTNNSVPSASISQNLEKNKSVSILNNKRKRTNSERLSDTLSTTSDISNGIGKKIKIKEAYYTKKLELLERIAIAKERSAVAKEQSVAALLKIAESL